DTCRTVKCPSNKWRLDDGTVADTVPHCAQSKIAGQERSAGWFLTIDSEDREITDGSCYADLDCNTHSHLKFDCLPDSDCVQATQLSDGSQINCTSGYELKFGNSTTSMLTCNPSDGLYYNGSLSVPRASSLF
ncbi:hypothetical protein PFISCL1PPCAC_360, partial [Pristionchus fissidentatus]